MRDAHARLSEAFAAPAAAGVTQSAQDAAGAVWATDFKGTLLPILGPSQLGAGVNVAVVDTGVDSNHPALIGAVQVSRCLIEGANPTSGGPVQWGAASWTRSAHGTHVAGIVAARPGTWGS